MKPKVKIELYNDPKEYIEELKNLNIDNALDHAERIVKKELAEAKLPYKWPSWLRLLRDKGLPPNMRRNVNILFWAHNVRESLVDEEVDRATLAWQAFRFAGACAEADYLPDYLRGRAVRTRIGIDGDERGNRQRPLISDEEKKEWRDGFRKLQALNQGITKRAVARKIKADTNTIWSVQSIRRYL